MSKNKAWQDGYDSYDIERNPLWVCPYFRTGSNKSRRKWMDFMFGWCSAELESF